MFEFGVHLAAVNSLRSQLVHALHLISLRAEHCRDRYSAVAHRVEQGVQNVVSCATLSLNVPSAHGVHSPSSRLRNVPRAHPKVVVPVVVGVDDVVGLVVCVVDVGVVDGVVDGVLVCDVVSVVVTELVSVVVALVVAVVVVVCVVVGDVVGVVEGVGHVLHSTIHSSLTLGPIIAWLHRSAVCSEHDSGSVIPLHGSRVVVVTVDVVRVEHVFVERSKLHPFVHFQRFLPVHGSYGMVVVVVAVVIFGVVRQSPHNNGHCVMTS